MVFTPGTAQVSPVLANTIDVAITWRRWPLTLLRVRPVTVAAAMDYLLLGHARDVQIDVDIATRCRPADRTQWVTGRCCSCCHCRYARCGGGGIAHGRIADGAVAIR